MADRIAVMNDGRIEQLGRPLELYDRPVNLFVAQFIGSPAMNVFEGVFRNGAVEALGTRWPSHTKANEGQKVKYGVRPEHVDIGAGGIGGGKWWWSSRWAPRRSWCCKSAVHRSPS